MAEKSFWNQYQRTVGSRAKCLKPCPYDPRLSSISIFDEYVITRLIPVSKFCQFLFTAMVDLIRLIHGNVQSSKKLVREFRVYWQRKSQGSSPKKSSTQEADCSMQEEDKTESDLNISLEANQEKKCAISKRQLEMKLKEIAVYEKQQGFNKNCWYVKKPVMEKYKLVDLPVPTQWQWITVVKDRRQTTSPNTLCQTPNSGRKTPTIKHFTTEVSPTKLFSPATPKTTPGGKRCTPNAMSPVTPGQPGIKTPTQRRTSLQGGKKTPNIKQFVVPQASPFSNITPSTPKSAPSPLGTPLASPLAMLLKASPKTLSAPKITPKNCGKQQEIEVAKPVLSRCSVVLKKSQLCNENHSLPNASADDKLVQAQPTLLSMLSKAAATNKGSSTSSKAETLSESVSEDKNANSKVVPPSDAKASSSVRGLGTADEPMEIDWCGWTSPAPMF